MRGHRWRERNTLAVELRAVSDTVPDRGILIQVLSYKHDRVEAENWVDGRHQSVVAGRRIPASQAGGHEDAGSRIGGALCSTVYGARSQKDIESTFAGQSFFSSRKLRLTATGGGTEIFHSIHHALDLVEGDGVVPPIAASSCPRRLVAGHLLSPFQFSSV